MIVNCYLKYKDCYFGHFMINKPDYSTNEENNGEIETEQ